MARFSRARLRLDGAIVRSDDAFPWTGTVFELCGRQRRPERADRQRAPEGSDRRGSAVELRVDRAPQALLRRAAGRTDAPWSALSFAVRREAGALHRAPRREPRSGAFGGERLLRDSHRRKLRVARRPDRAHRGCPGARSGEVFYYDEAPAPAAHRQRVARHTKGFAFPFVEPCWRDPGESELARTELRAGTVLEPTGRSVVVTSCGPGTSVDEFRLGKQRIWVLVALYEFVPNPNGGSSLGGIDFLEIAD